MFEYIEKVVYINLEHRADRRKQIESELFKYFPSEKVIRFNAIKHSHGGVGCSASHITVLELAIKEGWKNYLVVEDDAMWSNFDKGYALLEGLIKNPYDVIMFGATYAETLPNFRITKGQTTTAYIVNKHYYQTLLETFYNSFQIFKNIKNIQVTEYEKYAIDVSWFPLQSRDNWFVIIPSLMIQRPSYSDIQGKFTNYAHLFI
jgi:glycosyl transferase family 25